MELLAHGGEYHEIGDGGRLVMMMATDPPLQFCPPEEEQEVAAAPYRKMQ